MRLIRYLMKLIPVLVELSANQIGQKLQEIGKYKQVLYITHLALKLHLSGNNIYLLQNKKNKGSMNTHIYSLTKEDRVKEIAKMTVGENVTPISLENASELLQKNQRGRK